MRAKASLLGIKKARRKTFSKYLRKYCFYMHSHLSAFLAQQKLYFQTGATRDLDFRAAQLKKLAVAIKNKEPDILKALHADLGKPQHEAYLSEIGFIYEEIRFVLRHLKQWAKPKRVRSTLLALPSKARIHAEPKGLVLILGPWNYPFQLLVSPLIGSIAAGNCSVLKPSELAPATSKVVAELMHECFPPGFVWVAEGGVEVSQFLLHEPFDHIFFTGGTQVGRKVMEAASKNLVPVTLELGGKSPCVIDGDVNIEVAARRVAWGKFFNAGQTCIAPDFVLVDRKIKQPFVQALRNSISQFFGEDPRKSPDYGRIINQRHFDRLQGYLAGKSPVVGGQSLAEEKYLAPTVLVDTPPTDAVMQEEIFGPILPVLEYNTLEEAIRFINDRPKPLALYFFSNDKAKQKRMLMETSFGGGCMNDTLMHLTTPHLPFGGIGASGMGAYHGKHSFDVFSHKKSVLYRGFHWDVALRYPPYGESIRWLRRWLG
jgi:aldehyde dehydrogenase (NAD+)